MQQVLPSRPSARRRKPRWHAQLHGTDLAWALAFIAPFLAFVVYPIGFALWMAARPSLHAQLLSDPNFRGAVVSTLLRIGIGVTLQRAVAVALFHVPRVAGKDCPGRLHPALAGGRDTVGAVHRIADELRALV